MFENVISNHDANVCVKVILQLTRDWVVLSVPNRGLQHLSPLLSMFILICDTDNHRLFFGVRTRPNFHLNITTTC